MYKELTFLKQIGEGSFGRVYMARWRETTVAVKVPTIRMSHARLLLMLETLAGSIDSCPNCCLSSMQVLHRQTGDHLDDDDLPLDPCPSAGSPDPILNALQKVRIARLLWTIMQSGLAHSFDSCSAMPDQVAFGRQ
jgi:serine/threonine protein kinase